MQLLSPRWWGTPAPTTTLRGPSWHAEGNGGSEDIAVGLRKQHQGTYQRSRGGQFKNVQVLIFSTFFVFLFFSELKQPTVSPLFSVPWHTVLTRLPSTFPVLQIQQKLFGILTSHSPQELMQKFQVLSQNSFRVQLKMHLISLLFHKEYFQK